MNTPTPIFELDPTLRDELKADDLLVSTMNHLMTKHTYSNPPTFGGQLGAWQNNLGNKRLAEENSLLVKIIPVTGKIDGLLVQEIASLLCKRYPGWFLPVTHVYESNKEILMFRSVSTHFTLEECLDKLTLDQRFRISIQLCQVFQLFNELNLYGVSLNPKNILITSDYKHICIPDLDRLTLPGTPDTLTRSMERSTDFYASELYFTKTPMHPSSATDCFNLGALISLIILGRTPVCKEHDKKRKFSNSLPVIQLSTLMRNFHSNPKWIRTVVAKEAFMTFQKTLNKTVKSTGKRSGPTAVHRLYMGLLRCFNVFRAHDLIELYNSIGIRFQLPAAFKLKRTKQPMKPTSIPSTDIVPPVILNDDHPDDASYAEDPDDAEDADDAVSDNDADNAEDSDDRDFIQDDDEDEDGSTSDHSSSSCSNEHEFVVPAYNADKNYSEVNKRVKTS